MVTGREGYAFDLLTQRFLVSRWETELGRTVHKEITEGLRESVDIRAILARYTLEHPQNVEPYGYPYYPKDAMAEDTFWVLTQHDLRGICLYNENFEGSPSFEKVSLSYASLYNCDLTRANLEMTDLSYAQFEKCKMDRVILAYSGGFSVAFLNCSVRDSCFAGCGFRDCDFSGSDFRGAFFLDSHLEDIKVSHQTRFDTSLAEKWETASMPPEQRPDVLRAIRMAYEAAEIWPTRDRFVYAERTQHMKHILWPQFTREKSAKSFLSWLSSLLSNLSCGYATKPLRVLLLGLLAVGLFSLLYLMLGTPNAQPSLGPAILESLYFSLTTFATLGYGDISYGADRPFMRLLSTVEALSGAVVIALFVVVLARKLLR